MRLLKKHKPNYGLTHVVTKGEIGLKKAVFDLLKLEKGKRFNGHTGPNECAFVILSGTCRFKGDVFDFGQIGLRKDVFSGKPTSVYLPCSHAYEITAVTEVEIGICAAESTLRSQPVMILPGDVTEFNLGVSNWSRSAHFIVDQKINAECLYVGETFLPPGKWAFPPHRHDVENFPEEVDMEEIYHFRIQPKSGFAVQVSYTDDRSRDCAYLVRDGDTTIIPNGYHPVGASPVDSVYFLWFMAGDRRHFLSKPDDDYSWVLKSEHFIKGYIL